MKRNLIKFLLWALAVILPFSLFLGITECLKNPYRETYLGAFENKYDHLYEAYGKKIVFIGGSSLPFGLDSGLMEKDLFQTYKVVNYGLYATLGTKMMLDTSLDALSSGDIVVIAPELMPQTYSLYFNPEAALQATNGFSPMLSGLTLDNKISLFYRNFLFGFEKITHAVNGTVLAPSGIYAAASLDDYGDMIEFRDNNIMNGGYDENMTVTLDDALLNDEFLDYVNDYIAAAKDKGATVYFSFSPTNIAAIRTSENKRAEFEEALSEKLDCELLLSLEDALIDKRYFYDTNFHLNSAGQIYFTKVLSLAVKDKLGMPLESTIEVPAPPALEEEVVLTPPVTDETVPFDQYTGEANIDYADWFLYEENGNTYTVVGVKPEHYGMTEVILPSVYLGKNVTALAGDALSLCTELTAVHIGKSYKSLEAYAFRGCIALEAIYLYETDGNRIAPPSEHLLSGCARTVKLFIPTDSSYRTGYVWSAYEDSFAYFTPYQEETE
ncbi:MAG: hypothetical protein IJW46_01745 [Clostridia bacterium]|nr:hypothetical protein [Clostridia bacterium]